MIPGRPLAAETCENGAGRPAGLEVGAGRGKTWVGAGSLRPTVEGDSGHVVRGVEVCGLPLVLGFQKLQVWEQFVPQ